MTMRMSMMGLFRCVFSSYIFHFTILTIVFLLESSSSHLLPSQKTTMLNLYDHLHNQTSSLQWNKTNSDPCSWSGVTCTKTNTTSSVTTLSISNLNIQHSSFLPVACRLDSLEVLDVSKNRLSLIPHEFFTLCGGIQGLKLVNFSRNRISGPLPSFSNGFAKLESLDLSYNHINGTIELQLSGLAGLKRLNLSVNHFTGTVPVKLGESIALEELQLSSNLFQGHIPELLSEFKNLRVLDLSKNQLIGNIPSKVGQLQKLEILVLSENGLNGEVPKFISKITTLQRFAANQNNFTGEIPSGISKFLKNLDLSYNNLVGFIPNDFLSHENLQIVDFTYNKLKGPLPVNVSPNMVRLRLGSNAFNGSISRVNWSELRNLVYLELDNNTFDGPIPPHLGSCKNLTLLSLGGNKFSGVLPDELGNLTHLQVLNLQLNNIVGRIPSAITSLSNLQKLNMSWNSLSGSIPQSISGLIKIQYLHLQENSLSGTIPRSIGEMNSLIELQLGKNRLSSPIPPMPKYLQYALNLSNNLFEGPIPHSLELSSLEILDLSDNKFSGNIPSFLVTMQSLTLLLLNNNNLSGDIPPFRPAVVVEYSGNNLVINHSQLSHKKTISALRIVEVIGAAFFGVMVASVSVFLLRHKLYKVDNIKTQAKNEINPLPQSIKNQMLTTNKNHKSNIDFSKAMEAVMNPLNLMLKTKYSSYYEVIMPSRVSYFVKKINLCDGQLGSQENLGQELEALGKLNNSNIMTPLAYTLAADNVYLFYENTYKGTLFDVLHRSSDHHLDWASRCSIAVGIAQGLTSLHGCSSGPILLFDLSSKTIMLKSFTVPQIADIELYKVIDPSKSTSSLSAVAGSVGYISPEYAYTMRVTQAGNVYSFGVILLELLTGKQAVSGGTELAKWVLSNSSQPQKWDWMLDVSIIRKSPAVKNQMLSVLKIALACINASSEARPKMKSVLRMLLNAI